MQRRYAAFFVLLLTGSVAFASAKVFYHRAHGLGEKLVEPSVNLLLNTDPHDSLDVYSLLRSNARNDLPVVVPHILDFLYLVHYWPEQANRLYPVSLSSNTIPYHLNRAVRVWCHLTFNPEETFDQFLPTHPDFLLYGPPDVYPVLSYLMAHGGEIQLLKTDLDHRFVAKIRMRAADKIQPATK